MIPNIRQFEPLLPDIIINSLRDSVAAVMAVLLLSLATPGGAQIFTEDFNGFTAPGGNFNGGQ